MPTPGYLSQSLRRPLPTKDDGILRTVADAQFGASRRLAAGKRQSHGRCAREGPAAPPRRREQVVHGQRGAPANADIK
jgi:hypothetical protein